MHTMQNIPLLIGLLVLMALIWRPKLFLILIGLGLWCGFSLMLCASLGPIAGLIAALPTIWVLGVALTPAR